MKKPLCVYSVIIILTTDNAITSTVYTRKDANNNNLQCDLMSSSCKWGFEQ